MIGCGEKVDKVRERELKKVVGCRKKVGKVGENEWKCVNIVRK